MKEMQTQTIKVIHHRITCYLFLYVFSCFSMNNSNLFLFLSFLFISIFQATIHYGLLVMTIKELNSPKMENSLYPLNPLSCSKPVGSSFLLRKISYFEECW